jgi:hypothetical protein
MYDWLGWFAIFAGICVIAATTWEMWKLWRATRANPETPLSTHLLRLFSRLTWLDIAMTMLFIVGMMFLLADVIAMGRDRLLYPMYRYGYLLSSFCYLLFGMLFLWLRMFIVLHFGSVSPAFSTSISQTIPVPESQKADTESPAAP